MRTFFYIILAVVLAGCGGSDKAANQSGTLEATEVDLAPSMGGRVLEARFELGDAVKAGDTLLVLDTELIALQRAQANANRASLEAQKRVVGDQQAQASANLKLFEATFARTKALLDSGVATHQQLDEARAKRDVATEQVQAARHQIEALTADESKIDAALAVFDRQLNDGLLVTPISGTVIMKAAETGEFATPGAIAYRIADLSSLELRVFLDEQDLDKVRIGQSIQVLVDALEQTTIPGTVYWVSSEAEFTPKNAQTKQARTQLVYAVKLRVANSDGKLKIGMPAEIVLK